MSHAPPLGSAPSTMLRMVPLPRCAGEDQPDESQQAQVVSRF